MYLKLLKYQRELRKNMPSPERILWNRIRNEQLGIKFRRQYAIENRIFDFYAPKIKLAIEIDGESHFNDEQSRQKELFRDELLFKEYGIKVIRFLNPEVTLSTDNVIEEITRYINPPS